MSPRAQTAARWLQLALLLAAGLHLLPPPQHDSLSCAHPIEFLWRKRPRVHCASDASIALAELFRAQEVSHCLDAPSATTKVRAQRAVTLFSDCSIRTGRISGVTKRLLGLPLDLNRAQISDLVTLPRIGPTLARRIVAYRAERGPFRSLEQLAQVRGIGEKTIRRLAPYVAIGSPDP